MNLLSGQGDNFLSKIANNVRSAISGRPSKPTLSDAERQIQGTPTRTTRSAASSSRQMSPDTGSAKWKTRIVSQFLQGTYGDEIIVSDDDNDLPDASPRKVHKQTNITNFDKPPLSTRLATSTFKTDEAKSISEERRLLGAWEESPSDAVTVQIPSRRLEMPFAKPNSKFNAYKPHNGLDQPSSSKSKYYHLQTRDGDKSLTRERVRSRSSPPTRERPTRQTEVEDRPIKRRRLSSSSTIKSTSTVVDQFQSIDGKGDVTPRSEKSLGTLYGYEPPKENIQQKTKSSIRNTPLRNINAQATRGVAPQSQSNRRSSSPDALFQSDEEFMRKAKQQRRSEQEDSTLNTGIEEQATFSEKPARTRHPPQGQSTKPRHRSNNTVRTPEQSKMSARLREGYSPDALQAEFDSSKKQYRVRKTALHTMNGSKSATYSFELRTFVAQAFGGLTDCIVDVAEDLKKIHIRRQSTAGDDTNSNICEFSMSLIRKLIVPKAGLDYERTKILGLSLSLHGVLNERTCYLEFRSHEGYDEFHNLIMRLDNTIGAIYKDLSFLESSLANAWARKKPLPQASTEDLSVHSNSRHQPADAVHDSRKENRRRTIDGLDAPKPKPATIQSHKLDHDHKHQDLNGNTDVATSDTNDANYDQKYSLRKSRRIPEKNSTPPIDLFEVSHRRQGPVWTEPLVYPLSGKRRETVSWEDLERLEDDHYLNDSLVSLFLRYLQEQADFNTLKRMHFFNTFFYAKLTTSFEGKSKNRINYDGVANWTKLFDLFSRDFIIIPVNEHFHWYAMIVCNLKWFKKHVDQDQEEEEEVEIMEDSNLIAVEEEEPDVLGDILQSDVLPPKKHTSSAMSEGIQNILPVGTKPNANRRVPRKPRPQRKWDVTKPIIITLDSLNMSRSRTAGTLKEYIVEEAKQKQSWDICKEDISGMTAKNIPYQKNLSDCGLYMCMYIEQFMRDPDAFVHSILQRDIDRIKWPQSIASAVLRQRMYDTMQNIHSVQMKSKNESGIPAVGSILIRDEDFHHGMKASQMSPIGTQEHVIRGLDFYDDLARARTKGDATNRPEFSEYATDFIDTKHLPELTIPPSTEGTQAYVEIWDDDLPRQQRRSPVELQAPQHINMQYSTRIASRHFPEELEDHDEPELQSGLPLSNHHGKHTMSPELRATHFIRDTERHENRSRSKTTSEIDGVSISNSPLRSRPASQMSVDTDYLTGDRSYQDNQDESEQQRNEPEHDADSEWSSFGDDLRITGVKMARVHTNVNALRPQSEVPDSVDGGEEQSLVDITTSVDDDDDMLMR